MENKDDDDEINLPSNKKVSYR